MPDIMLASGALVVISTEDVEIMDQFTWRVWELNGTKKVVHDRIARGRSYRMHLHREIAFRMDPKLLRIAYRVRVTAINRDYQDVRRENLEITVRPQPKAGAPKRPRGYRDHVYKGTGGPRPANEPPAWSWDGCRDAALRGDG